MTRWPTRRDLLTAATAGGTSLVGGCLTGGGDDTTVSRPEFRLGSKLFAENQLFAWLSFEALLGRTDVQPVHNLGIGQAGENWTALRTGEIDCYWEYTGTVLNLVDVPTRREFDSAEALYERVDAAVESTGDRRLRRPAPVDNHYVLLARPEWAAETGVETVSGLLTHLREQPETVDVAFGAAFRDRPDGWNALLAHYGLDASDRVAVEPATTTVDPLLVYDHLRAGLFDVGVGYATSPHLDRWSFVRLTDDRGFFPFYQPAALVDEDALGDGVGSVLDAVAASVASVETVQALTARIVFDGEPPRTVARDHLDRTGVR